ncbi:MAG: hypothetical protein JXB14_08335 [Candidatus Altiarchaeota archaeon]|nr:hypothetical protein [Candidatus Altiarchaeota archaeon]
MNKIVSIGIMAGLVLLMAPIALAEEAIVGIVYRGWSDSECNKEFGERATAGVPEMVTTEMRRFKGPLTARDGSETSCYCKEGYVVSADKKSCVTCESMFPNKPYVTSIDVAETVLEAKLLHNGQDVGCRCRAKNGNLVFDRVENNDCKYKAISPEDQKCNAKYPGSQKCGEDKAKKVGDVDGIECCCQAGFDLQNGACVASAGSADSKACKDQWASQFGAGNRDAVDVCKDQQSPDDSIRITDVISPSDPTKTIKCCCADGYARDPRDGVCKSTKDECTDKVANSVKSTHFFAGGESITATNGWDQAVISRLQGLSCNCQRGFTKRDTNNDGKWDECNKVSNKCDETIPGSVGEEATDKGIRIGAGQGWDQTVLDRISHLSCWCKADLTPVDTDGKAGFEACGKVLNNVKFTCKSPEVIATGIKGVACYEYVEGHPFPPNLASVKKDDAALDAIICGPDKIVLTSQRNSNLNAIGSGLYAATLEPFVDVAGMAGSGIKRAWNWLWSTPKASDAPPEPTTTKTDIAEMECEKIDWGELAVDFAQVGLEVGYTEAALAKAAGQFLTRLEGISLPYGGAVAWGPDFTRDLQSARNALGAGRNSEALVKMESAIGRIPAVAGPELAEVAAARKEMSVVGKALAWTATKYGTAVSKLGAVTGKLKIIAKPVEWLLRGGGSAVKLLGTVGRVAGRWAGPLGLIVSGLEGVRTGIRTATADATTVWSEDRGGMRTELTEMEPFKVNYKIVLESAETNEVSVGDNTHEFKFLGISGKSQLVFQFNKEAGSSYWVISKNYLVSVNLGAVDQPLQLYTCKGLQSYDGTSKEVMFSSCTVRNAKYEDLQASPPPKPDEMIEI